MHYVKDSVVHQMSALSPPLISPLAASPCEAPSCLSSNRIGVQNCYRAVASLHSELGPFLIWLTHMVA